MPFRSLLVLVSAVTLSAAEPQWKHLSTEKGDLPLPWAAREQTAVVVFDFDRDGKNDFVAPRIDIWLQQSAAKR
jgi:hypothetical protein